MSALATLAIWLAFAVLGYGVGRHHEQILASRPRKPSAQPIPRFEDYRDERLDDLGFTAEERAAFLDATEPKEPTP